MYNPVGVSKLSETQKIRLRNRHPVRIKKGTANKLHLTQEQIKKLESAARRGAAYTVTLNPEQAQKHGAGFFGDIATKVKELANKHKDLINPIIKDVKVQDIEDYKEPPVLYTVKLIQYQNHQVKELKDVVDALKKVQVYLVMF